MSQASPIECGRVWDVSFRVLVSANQIFTFIPRIDITEGFGGEIRHAPTRRPAGAKRRSSPALDLVGDYDRLMRRQSWAILAFSLMAATGCHEEGVSIQAPAQERFSQGARANGSGESTVVPVEQEPLSDAAGSRVDDEVAINRTCPIGMQPIPGGAFTLPFPPKSVRVIDFCIDRLEVSAGEYEQCASRGLCASSALNCGPEATFGRHRVSAPINCVVWEEASAYCRIAGKRLPTSVEWEWVARGRDEGRPYPWGSGPPVDQLCWSGLRPTSEPCTVGAFPNGASRDGVLDMSGNVWEWTDDGRGPRARIRGGDWGSSDPLTVSVLSQFPMKKEERNTTIGFRCAASFTRNGL